MVLSFIITRYLQSTQNGYLKISGGHTAETVFSIITSITTEKNSLSKSKCITKTKVKQMTCAFKKFIIFIKIIFKITAIN